MYKNIQTIIERLDPHFLQNNTNAIKKAADIILKGGLVAFPTETVYGLGANALNPEAVKKIFEAKGRPPDNPLIIHIASLPELKKCARDIPDVFYKLADAFWPGPLTLILQKGADIPYEATGGLETAALRMPAHKTAIQLILESGVPIAAPSSNLSGKPSATDAFHVQNDLFGKIDMILDGGPSQIGLESTVADISVYPPKILRPGAVTMEMLLEVEPSFTVDCDKTGSPKSPGMKYTHYKPSAQVIIVSGENENTVKKINIMAAEFLKNNKNVGILTNDESKDFYDSQKYRIISAGSRHRLYAGIYLPLSLCLVLYQLFI